MRIEMRCGCGASVQGDAESIVEFGYVLDAAKEFAREHAKHGVKSTGAAEVEALLEAEYICAEAQFTPTVKA